MNSRLTTSKRIGAREARIQFANLLGEVHYSGQAVIIERSGKAMVAMIPIAVYEAMSIATAKTVDYSVAAESPTAPVLAELRVLFSATQALPALQTISEEEIAAEVAAYRAERL